MDSAGAGQSSGRLSEALLEDGIMTVKDLVDRMVEADMGTEPTLDNTGTMEPTLFLFGMASAGRASLARRMTDMLRTGSDVIIAVRADEAETYQRALAGTGDDVTLVVTDPELVGVHVQRNAVYEEAEKRGTKYLIMVDDDVRIYDPSEMFGTMLAIMETTEWLGAVSSCPGFYLRGAEFTDIDVEPGEFQVSHALNQVMMLRMSALRELVTEITLETGPTQGWSVRTGPYELPVFDDQEIALRMWSKGWGIGRLLFRGHDAIRPRVTRSESGGGFGVYGAKWWMEQRSLDIKYLQKRYSDVITIKETVDSTKATHRTRVNWPNLIKPVRERWGTGLYKDSRGREI